MAPDADAAVRRLYAALDTGEVLALQDERGHVHLVRHDPHLGR